MSKQIKISSLSNVIMAVALVLAGSLIEYRFHSLEMISKNAASSVTSNDATAEQLSKLIDTDAPIDKSDVDFGIFWEVWKLLERDYIDQDKLDADKMVHGAISGMTASIGDPYTMYLPPELNERSAADLAGSFYGVGIELGYVDGILAAIAPLSGTPADKAGVRAGDLIINVKDEAKGFDESTEGWSLNKAVENIRGPKDTPVILTIVREGETEPLEVTIYRGEIIVKSVEVDFVENTGKRVAHIKLSRFGERTNAEWDEVVTEIVAQKDSIDGVVLDMRNNPGGFFNDAIYIASEFIKSGVIVSQKDVLQQQDYQAQGKGRLVGMPVEVLVNKGSASASEIVAGALRDQLQAKLVGQKTFGKGTVQDRRELSNGGGIHITIARWLLPSGEWIHENGIPVDVEVEQDYDTEADEQLLKAIEVL
ncbi:MAG: S41 family peptidase [Candidatus Pacebacteria bacterium]|nr:S41 family peptidase [Candidatus Paceibacterota bacterium]PIR63386.1 MAG: peptidase S41 [Candidatus Pacebacteria bacterium CG10_big_fil_rev_8_21_14_0_10_40_26]PIZ79134.1 MAG: peptidase S41 [Candidatus Pacebacteria bacterium CG_4_10_14_0_2_um_filter_40_20]PJA69178.1 MAG: peptidase S41 [Candidatus Pacebacteria bacterium CG_4_9_14_3_um_filter_40_12]PJC42100.1 MAG: peptidase S41 [Candidatus Pacebacteria bacterium CG_4_9_14_0_2_um_filter_40_15]